MQMSVANILSKFIVIEGDCSSLRMEISESDRNLITENVTFIYHLSANIRFDEVKILFFPTANN